MKKATLLIALFLLLISSGFALYHFKIASKSLQYKGMNLVAPINEIKGQTFEELKFNNVNSVSLVPYAFVNVENGGVYYNNERQWWGEKLEGISACSKIAQEYKMTVMLKPHLWINHGFYTGNLHFDTDAEWEKWETNYEKYILEFARLAQRENIELFCFGTELGNSVAKRPEFWNQLIQKIRKIYRGKLTYAANWDDFDKVPFWNELDYIGIDAYFPLSEAESPSIDALNLAWQKHIEKIEIVQKKFNKKVLFTEFGYRNSNFATITPWTENNIEKNNEAQANAYEALFQSMTKKTWFAGGFAWKWYPDDYYKKNKNEVDYTPQGKPALGIIKKWYE